jgi:hypothetical protein
MSATRFDRTAAWLLIGVLAFAGLVAALTLALLSRPSDGWLIPFTDEQQRLAYYYGDGPTPLRAGDQVLAVNGYDVQAIYSLPQALARRPDLGVGQTIVYTVQRAGQPRPVEVPVVWQAPSPAAIARALAHTAADSPADWSWPLAALLIFWRRPGSQPARLLLLAMLPHAAVVKLGWAATSVVTQLAPPALRLAWEWVTNFWSWLFWPTILWLVLSFPMPVFPLSRWPRLVPPLLYVLPASGVMLSLVTGSEGPVAVALVGALAALLLALVVALVNAVRQPNAVARAQARWVILGFTLSQGVVLAAYLLGITFPGLLTVPAWVLWPLGLALPICLGIAITRYRLWDIDVIIRRTLIYSVLTAMLALAYFGSVLMLEGVFRAVTGQGQNALVVVLSTLTIAALFGPLRGRVQAVIDQRFFRKKYDAARTLAGFAAGARDETNLEQLSAHLVGVVNETMQPASVGLWLKKMPTTQPGGDGSTAVRP